MEFSDGKNTGDRARLLIKAIGPKKLAQISGMEHNRLLNVSRGVVRVSSEEIDALVKAYPSYALWIASGKVAPESGQTSPEYDMAHSNLSKPSAG